MGVFISSFFTGGLNSGENILSENIATGGDKNNNVNEWIVTGDGIAELIDDATLNGHSLKISRNDVNLSYASTNVTINAKKGEKYQLKTKAHSPNGVPRIRLIAYNNGETVGDSGEVSGKGNTTDVQILTSDMTLNNDANKFEIMLLGGFWKGDSCNYDDISLSKV